MAAKDRAAGRRKTLSLQIWSLELIEWCSFVPFVLLCGYFLSCAFCGSLGVIAGAVAEFEFLFLQVGVGDFDGDLSVGAVVLLVRR